MTASSPAAPSPFLANPDKKHFIDGKWQPSLTGESIQTFNPATGRVLATLGRGRKEDVDAAVASARRAFEGPWSRFTPHQRYALMLRVCDVLEKNYEELATLESLDMGAPLARTRAMKNGLIQTVMYFASQAMNWTGSTIPNSLPGNLTTLTLKAPVGVVGGIIPWNAPLISMWWIMGGVLATGCTGVIKTAEDASLTTLRTAELLSEAGVPPGVINVVTGLGAEAGAALAAHMDVDRVAFTGSTATGREIIKASAGNIKRVQLELGGKSPDIVFADANLDKAVPGAAMGVYNNSGQICSAGTRIFVQRSIQEEFVARWSTTRRGSRSATRSIRSRSSARSSPSVRWNACWSTCRSGERKVPSSWRAVTDSVMSSRRVTLSHRPCSTRSTTTCGLHVRRSLGPWLQ
jgi:aldehyde dehydrogenase (NAD+)